MLQKTDFLAVFTTSFIKKHFRVTAMRNLLPGQNLKNGQIGFVDFGFPGAVSVSIDWLNRKIECIAGTSVNLADVRPVFRTVRKNSSVSIKGASQESGISVVKVDRDVTYRIDVPGVGYKYWTVKVRKM